jgi:rod shape-determining protein MreC
VGVVIKAIFVHEPTYGLRLLLVVCIACGLMFLDHKVAHFSVVRSKVALVSHGLYQVVDAPFALLRGVGEMFVSRRDLRLDNQYLHEQNLILQGRLQRLDALEMENQRLHALYESGGQITQDMMIAQIINVDPDPFTRQIVLNRGKVHGVNLGQTVIDAQGIMGSIIAVNDFDSRVILITDSSHAVPVEDVRNGFRSIAAGTGDGLLELKHVPNTSDIQEGDVMVTSGLGGRFPAGFPVGVVTYVKHEPGNSFAIIKLQPKAQLDRGRQVLLLKGGL